MTASGIGMIIKEWILQYTNSQNIKQVEKDIPIIILTNLQKEKQIISKNLQEKKKPELKEVASHHILGIIMKRKKSGWLQILNTNEEKAA
jgi:hypothetical protein